MKTLSIVSFVVLRNSTAPESFSSRLSGRITSSLNYNWASDNRSFNMTLLPYQRIVMVPGRDIEWELRVPPFRLGPASELIRQINERWAYVGARPLSVAVCHLFVPWILAQSDSVQPFTAAAIPLYPLTCTGIAGLMWAVLKALKQSFPIHFQTAFVQFVLFFPRWRLQYEVQTVYMWFYYAVWCFDPWSIRVKKPCELF